MRETDNLYLGTDAYRKALVIASVLFGDITIPRNAKASRKLCRVNEMK